MNRYQSVFSELKHRNEIGFIPFTIAGDPDIDKSDEIIRTYIRNGADILELGFPFSDPVADGPINQRAAQRSIANGLNHQKFFAQIKRIRQYSDIPIGILIYANSVYHLGYNEFCRRASLAGIDSLLVADLPPEESGQLCTAMKRHGIGTVYIVSELTPDKRAEAICNQVDSFVYVVSRLGTTGTDHTLNTTVAHTLHRLKKLTDKPLAVGFGISTPAHVQQVKKAGAHAAIVGSALVKVIEENLKTPTALLKKIGMSVKRFKEATL